MFKYFLKIVHIRQSLISQSLYKVVICGGSFGLGELLPSHTPDLEYCRLLLVEIMKDVMALIRGCWRPNPPSLMDILAMMCEYSGSEGRFVMLHSSVSVISLNFVDREPFHKKKLCGKSAMLELKTSELKR